MLIFFSSIVFHFIRTFDGGPFIENISVALIVIVGNGVATRVGDAGHVYVDDCPCSRVGWEALSQAIEAWLVGQDD